MQGLISTAISRNDPLSSIQGYKPFETDINPETDTVQGQLSALMKTDNPLIQQSDTASLQGMNQRGLINSSIALGAGRDALYKNLTPIANADANTYNTNRRENAAARNRGFEFTAQNTNQGALQALQGNQQIGMQGLQGQQALEQIGARGSQESQLMTQKLGADRQMLMDSTASETTLLNEKARLETDLLAATGEQKITLMNRQASLEQELLSSKAAQEAGLVTLRGSIETQLQTMRGGQAENLAEIEASYKTLMQSSDSATKVYQQTMEAISKILLSTDMDAAAKDAAVTRQTELLRSGLQIIGDINQLDLTSLLDFGAITSGAPVTPTTDSGASAGDGGSFPNMGGSDSGSE